MTLVSKYNVVNVYNSVNFNKRLSKKFCFFNFSPNLDLPKEAFQMCVCRLSFLPKVLIPHPTKFAFNPHIFRVTGTNQNKIYFVTVSELQYIISALYFTIANTCEWLHSNILQVSNPGFSVICVCVVCFTHVKN